MNLKTVTRRSLVALMALAMTLSLTACGGKGLSTEDASQCVQVELDTTYKGEYTGFVDFYSNVTTQDAKDQHNNNVEGEAQLFLDAFGPESMLDGETIPASEMQLHRAKELYEKIYAQADYSIASSTKQDDGTFAVKVNIKPLNILHLVFDNLDAGFEDFWEKFDAVDTDSMTEDVFLDWYENTFAPEYYDTLLDLLESQIDSMEHMDEKSIVIQVQQDGEDGSLFFSDEDWINLDNLIIDYNF